MRWYMIIIGMHALADFVLLREVVEAVLAARPLTSVRLIVLVMLLFNGIHIWVALVRMTVHFLVILLIMIHMLSIVVRFFLRDVHFALLIGATAIVLVARSAGRHWRVD